MARVVSALLSAVFLLVGAHVHARPWEARRPLKDPLPAHQLRNPATWPAEPTVPPAIDGNRFREAFAHLCNVKSESLTAGLAPHILEVSAEAEVDPFLLAALAFYQGGCKPKPKAKSGVGLLRLNAAMYRQPGAPKPPVERSEWSAKNLRNPRQNLSVGARLLKMWEDGHREIDEAFGSAPHRTGVAHFFWGDDVRSSGHEDLVLTARRRLVGSYNAAEETPRATSLGVPIVSPLEGAPRVASSGPGEDRDGGRRHRGIDITAAIGEPVRAIADGVVTFAGVNAPGNPRRLIPPKKSGRWAYRQLGPGGIYVCIAHDDDRRVVSCYMHLSSYTVSVDDQVTIGQRIGSVGRSGVRVSPPHLHFEIRVNDRFTNPVRYLGDLVIPPKATMTYRYMIKAKRSRLRAARSTQVAEPGV